MTKRVLGLLLLAGFLLISCSPGKATDRAESRQSIPALNPEMASGEGEWERTVAEARKEGKVVVYSTAGTETRTALVKGFKDRYGFDVDFISGKGEEVSRKLLMERRAGLYLADIYTGGATTLINEIKPAGLLAPLELALVLTEVSNKKNWWGGNLSWIDGDKTILAFLAYPLKQSAINTDLAREGEFKTWKDLLNPKWKGKIILNDPTLAGTALRWFQVVSKENGIEYMKELVKQEPVIIRDQRQQIEWLARGKYSVAIGPKSDTMAEFIKAGAPLKFLDLQGSDFLSSGSGHLSLLDKAPHQRAAKLFVNWLLSREGQTIYSKAMLVQSARTDVPTDHLDPSTHGIREAGATYVGIETEDSFREKPAYAKLAQEVFGGLMK